MSQKLFLTYLTDGPEDAVTVAVDSEDHAEELLTAVGWDRLVEASVFEDLSDQIKDGNPYREVAVYVNASNASKLTPAGEVVDG